MKGSRQRTAVGESADLRELCLDEVPGCLKFL